VTHPDTARLQRYWTIWTIVLGLFLGLGLLKFGNPIILDSEIPAPGSLAEFLYEPWPAFWGQIAFLVIASGGILLSWISRGQEPRLLPDWRCGLPGLWLIWQQLVASHSVDPDLSRPTLRHFTVLVFAGYLGCYCLPRIRWPRWLLIGIFLALAICLVRAANQRWGGFRHDREALLEGQRTGWTNFATADLEQMQRSRMLVSTNGALEINPIVLIKLERARVSGTLVYPNALAGTLLLLLPVGLWLVVRETGDLRPPIRLLLIGLTVFLGVGGLFWTGSKSAWLIALAQVAVLLWFRPWPPRWRMAAVVTLTLVGLTAFGLRFQGYFAAGATSVSARFDYWSVAARTAIENPVWGTGPGTFMRPYASKKVPEAEMTRLVHNDYLEQFSDSGFIGGILYLVWIGSALWVSGRIALRQREPIRGLLWIGTAAWFVQGFVEFSLYIPGLAGLAFTFLGALTDGSSSCSWSTSSENSPRSIPRPSPIPPAPIPDRDTRNEPR
jgi:O-Antigen ligase